MRPCLAMAASARLGAACNGLIMQYGCLLDASRSRAHAAHCPEAAGTRAACQPQTAAAAQEEVSRTHYLPSHASVAAGLAPDAGERNPSPKWSQCTQRMGRLPRMTLARSF